MTSDQATASELTPDEMEAAAVKHRWHFVAVADANAVTSKLTDKKASKAHVAFAGQEQAGKQYGVWYFNSSAPQNWQLAEIPFDSTNDNDTDQVTAIVKQASVATVTFVGQLKKYFVWWLA